MGLRKTLRLILEVHWFVAPASEKKRPLILLKGRSEDQHDELLGLQATTSSSNIDPVFRMFIIRYIQILFLGRLQEQKN